MVMCNLPFTLLIPFHFGPEIAVTSCQPGLAICSSQHFPSFFVQNLVETVTSNFTNLAKDKR